MTTHVPLRPTTPTGSYGGVAACQGTLNHLTSHYMTVASHCSLRENCNNPRVRYGTSALSRTFPRETVEKVNRADYWLRKSYVPANAASDDLVALPVNRYLWIFAVGEARRRLANPGHSLEIGPYSPLLMRRLDRSSRNCQWRPRPLVQRTTGLITPLTAKLLPSFAPTQIASQTVSRRIVPT